MHRSRLWVAAAVSLGLLVVFNANLRSINSVDTQVTQHTALVLADAGSADLARFPDLVKNGEARGYIGGIDGHAYSSYPLLPALLAAPAYRVALTLGFIDGDAPEPWRIEAVGALVASAFVALACGVLVLVMVPAGGSPWAGAVVAVACGLGTPLWSTASQALWSHAPAVLFLAAGLGILLTRPADAMGSRRPLLVAGALLTFAVFCRQLLIVFPACAVVALWRSQAPRSNILLFVAGSALAAGVMVATNLLLLGSPLGGFVGLYATGVTTSTHAVTGAWSGHWLSGLAGVFLSPSRGLIVYIPIVLVVAAGLTASWREPLTRYALVVPTALYLGLWAKYAVWWGGHSFGPRLAADLAIPFALMATATVASWASWRGWTRAAAAVALSWSISIQGVGAFNYPAGDWNGWPLNVDLTHGRLWDWRDSQLSRTIRSGTYRQYQASLERGQTPNDDGPRVITDLDH